MFQSPLDLKQTPVQKQDEGECWGFSAPSVGVHMGNDKATTEWNAVSTTKDDSGEVPELKPQKQLLRQPSKV